MRIADMNNTLIIDLMAVGILLTLTWSQAASAFSIVASVSVFVYFTSRTYTLFVKPEYGGSWRRFFWEWIKSVFNR